MPQAPVQNETYIGTENFAAGMNDSDSVHLVPPNALTTIKNLLVDGGDLKAAWGTQTIADFETDAVYTWTAQVYGQTVNMTIAIKNQVIYVEDPANLGTFVPMYNAASDPETGSTNIPWKGSFAESQGFLYITGLGRKVFPVTDNNVQSTFGAAPVVFDGYAQVVTASVGSDKSQVVLSALPNIPTYTSLFPASMAGYKVTLTDDNGAVETRTLMGPATSGGLTAQVWPDFTTTAASGTAVVSGVNPMGIGAPQGCSIFVVGTVTGGTYGLSLSSPDGIQKKQGSTTLAYTTTPSDVQTYLNALFPALPMYTGVTCNVSAVTSGDDLPVSPYIITFNNLGNNAPPILQIYIYGSDGVTPADYMVGGGNYYVSQAPFVATIGGDSVPSGYTWLSYNSSGTATAADNTYRYKVVYANSSRGVTSNASNEFYVTVTAVNQDVKITGIPAFPLDTFGNAWGDWQIDQIQIWRTLVGGSTFYLLATIGRVSVAGHPEDGGVFLESYTDTMPDVDIVVPPLAFGLSGVNAVVWSDALNANHDLPPAISRFRSWNASLWGVNQFIGKDMRKSSILGPEYWSLIEVEGADPNSLPVNAGSYFEIGTLADPIVGDLPDIGSWATTGIAGSCLVVFTRTGAKRIYGATLADIEIVDTGFPGLLGADTAINCDGILMWESPEGTAAAPAGASVARIVDRGVRNDKPLYSSTGGVSQWEDACAVYWQGYCVLVAPNAAGTMQGWCCYLGSDKIGGNQFAWTRYEALDDVVSLHLSTANAHTSPGAAYDLWACTPTQIIRVAPWLNTFQGSPIDFTIAKEYAKLPGKRRDKWSIMWLDLEIKTQVASDIDLDVTIADVGQLNTGSPAQYPVDSYPKIISCDGRYAGMRRLISIPTTSLCRWPLVTITGEVSADFRVLSMELCAGRNGDLVGE